MAHRYRHPHLTYTEDGWYFITICTKNRECFFGEIRDSKMQRSPVGEIVEEYILLIEKLHPHVILDEWVVMPNHVHLLFKLIGEVEVVHAMSAQFVPPRQKLEPLVPKSVPALINHFKGAVTRRAKAEGIPFQWQERFHDTIPRTEDGVDSIREYIRQNPAKWNEDEFRSFKTP